MYIQTNVNLKLFSFYQEVSGRHPYCMFFFKINLFFGCVGSLLLCAGFP